MVKPSKWVMSAAAVAGLVCLAAGVLHAARTQQVTEMHVEVVELYTDAKGLGFNTPLVVAAHVKIVDQAGQPVESATVTGQFTGCRSGKGKSFATTNGDGFAHVWGSNRKCGCVYTFTVTDVSKSGATYEPQANVMTSDSRCLCGCN